jgi:benzoate/toluate 1,2-dioxygenase reductase component
VQCSNQLKPSCSPFLETTELIGRRWLSENAFEVELRRPPGFNYQAGHTLRLMHAHQKRYYALVSAPSEPTLQLCVHHVETGGMASTLAMADRGAKFEMTGPHGFFNFALSTRRPVFVATDTGIAPFVSMVRSGIRGFTLFHGARRAEEHYYRDLVSQAADKYIPYNLEIPENNKKPSGLFPGETAGLIAQHLKSGRYDFYLCGWQQMIREVVHLIDAHFPGSNVYTEVFY